MGRVSKADSCYRVRDIIAIILTIVAGASVLIMLWQGRAIEASGSGLGIEGKLTASEVAKDSK